MWESYGRLAVYSTGANGMTSCDTCMGGDIIRYYRASCITEMNTIPCNALIGDFWVCACEMYSHQLETLVLVLSPVRLA
jgi:hypothetical protein